MNIPHNWACSKISRERTLSDSCAFRIGQGVRVNSDLPIEMKYFTSGGKSAVITGRDLTTDYGICDYGYYPIYRINIDDEGESAWYPESTLVMLI